MSSSRGSFVASFMLRVYSLTTSKTMPVLKGSTCNDLCVLMAEDNQNPDTLRVVIFGLTDTPTYREPNDFILPILKNWTEKSPGNAINQLQFVVLPSSVIPDTQKTKHSGMSQRTKSWLEAKVAKRASTNVPRALPNPPAVSRKLTMILIGSTGAGKSSFGNFLASSDPSQTSPFNVYSGPNPGTKLSELKEVRIGLDLVGKNYLSLQLIDTPGLNEDVVGNPDLSASGLRHSKDLVNMINLCEQIQKLGEASGIFLCLKFDARLDKQVTNTIKYYRKLLFPLFDKGRVAVIQTQVSKETFDTWMEETNEKGKPVWEERCQAKVDAVVNHMKREEGVDLPGDMCFQVDSHPKKPIYPSNVSQAKKKTLSYYSHEEKVNIANAIKDWKPIECVDLSIPLPHNLELAREGAIKRIENAMCAVEQLKDVQNTIREKIAEVTEKMQEIEAMRPKQTWISKKGTSYFNLTDKLVRIVTGDYTLTEPMCWNAKLKEVEKGDGIVHIYASPNYMTLEHSEEYGCCWVVRACLIEPPPNYSEAKFVELSKDIEAKKQVINDLHACARGLVSNTESEKLPQMLEILQAPAKLSTIDKLIQTIAEVHESIEYKILDNTVLQK